MTLSASKVENLVCIVKLELDEEELLRLAQDKWLVLTACWLRSTVKLRTY